MVCVNKDVILYFYRPRSEASEVYVFTSISLFNLGGGDTRCIMG